jgi:pyruvate/2-oxoglutarate dehydrogenase complex dihydrolipoamide acyltransferase (E2) component
MTVKIVMPQLGESVVEGTIGKWLKKEGDPVHEFEPILEVTTDKVDTEVTATADGVLLKIEVPDGTTVDAGTVLGYIGQPGEDPASGSNGHVQSQVSQPAASDSSSRDLGFISPVVAKLAAEHKLDLAQINGTGLGGRITKKDVMSFVESRSKASEDTAPAQPVTAKPTATPATPPQPSAASAKPTTTLPITPASGDTVLPLTAIRKSIAEHMVKSKHTSPHVTTVFEVDMTRIIAHRKANKPAFDRDGVNLTFTPYFVAATAAALKAFPTVNSVFAEDKLLLKRDINIGMAVSLGDEGLIVPVIRNADDKSLLGLARAVNGLAARARNKQLKPEEVQGGTFTITNHGISGSLFATPIINQPQCGILGIGAIQKRVVVVSNEINGDTIAIRAMCYISLTFDHRILDGATADYFVGKVKEMLESWT